MRVARWKVMAGGLLLSAGGLMAVADGPVPAPGCQPLPLPCLPAMPAPAVTRVTLEQPIAVPAPPVLPLAALPPDAVTVRVKDAEPGTKLVRVGPPQPSATTVLVDPKAAHTTTRRGFATADGRTHEVVEGDHFVLPRPQPVEPKPTIPQTPICPDPKPAELPPSIPTPALTLPPATTPEAYPLVPTPGFTFAVPPDAKPSAPFVPSAAPAPAVPAEKPTPAKPEPFTAEKRLKVVLSMGDDRPRFEVRDGDETYLKVVSDRVEVKSAADKNDAATMKAGGKVGFVTPGGDGTCDELTILPGSGQVVAAGNVSFRHTWGRSETTVTAERMTFRLAHPGPTAIQAGYTPVR